MQSQSGVDNLAAELVRPVEVPHRVGVPRQAGRVEPVDVDVDAVRAEEVLKTSAIADVITPCAAGYSGWFGVVKRGRQPKFAARRSLYASVLFSCGGPRYGNSGSKSLCGPTPSSVTFRFVKMATLESPTSSVSRRPLSG